jgi:hypothetical protein
VSSAVKEFSEQELADLLRISRRNNERDGITGLLLYHEGNFMQVLEGAENTVEAILEKLRSDPRHKGVLVLLKESIQARDFPTWSMGYRTFSELPQEVAEGFSSFLVTPTDDLVTPQGKNRSRRLLSVFRQNFRL